jgi:hypothetical protein
MAPMKLPPRLARWFDVLRRAHERQEEEHLRAMAKANTWKGPGRKLRMPPPPPSPPGSRNTGGRNSGGRYTGGRNTGSRNAGGRYKGR